MVCVCVLCMHVLYVLYICEYSVCLVYMYAVCTCMVLFVVYMCGIWLFLACMCLVHMYTVYERAWCVSDVSVCDMIWCIYVWWIWIQYVLCSICDVQEKLMGGALHLPFSWVPGNHQPSMLQSFLFQPR